MSHDEPINVEWQQNAELRRVAASSKQPAENGVARGGATTSEARAGEASGTRRSADVWMLQPLSKDEGTQCGNCRTVARDLRETCSAQTACCTLVLHPIPAAPRPCSMC